MLSKQLLSRVRAEQNHMRFERLSQSTNPGQGFGPYDFAMQQLLLHNPRSGEIELHNAQEKALVNPNESAIIACHPLYELHDL